jgi:hypothetical protein
MRRIGNRLRFAEWLLLTVVIAVIILNCQSAAQRSLVNPAAAELTVEGERLRGLIEAGQFAPQDLGAVFERIRQESRLTIVSIHLLNHAGQVEAAAGVDRVQENRTGILIVAAIPIRWKALERAGVLEIAARLDHVSKKARPSAPVRKDNCLRS